MLGLPVQTLPVLPWGQQSGIPGSQMPDVKSPNLAAKSLLIITFGLPEIIFPGMPQKSHNTLQLNVEAKR